jgi:D-threo-aldose 1-dehydrogenase
MTNHKIQLPKVIFGTSALGNLYTAPDHEVKRQIVQECIAHTAGIPVFDSAGKYGAGLALESLGQCLRELNVAEDAVIISNKLGWFRTELRTPEPTFEPGIWKNLQHDAVQKISYEGIIECYHQGNQLLGGYRPKMLSVHDPDEYISSANASGSAESRYEDILEAYRAISDLKKQFPDIRIGVGAKDWRTIRKISADVELDWVMFANSLTIYRHPAALVAFMENLRDKGVTIINSAVFHAGFLTGGDYFDYQPVDPGTADGRSLLTWRDTFVRLCKKYGIAPAAACVNFGINAPGVKAIALNTTNPARVQGNVELAEVPVPQAFWDEMRAEKLIDPAYTYI